ncbi:MAG: spore maturation protein [Firmicutes bacterium]|nr:spore maturation protein [Bacillota bacterium]MCL5039127.1 spore maturation protein [Bacillota bacterium]
MLLAVLEVISRWAIPFLLLVIVSYGYFRGVKVYEVFVEGAQEGFDTAVRVMPYMITIFVAISIFRASGAMDLLAGALSPLAQVLGLPPELMPLALLRSVSGSGSLGLVTEILNHYGADSFVGRLASVMMGSSETTFFVLAVYFGSVSIRKTRHALPVGLLADLVAMIMAVVVCRRVFL